MCGIVGQVSFNKKVNKSFIFKSLESIEHRGKDYRGYKIFEDVSIGHNLLSITGNVQSQPLFDISHSIYAVVNGEFYNYEEIKKELSGINYITNSDSELIIHLYQKGILFEYLKNGKINGEFSFIIYDKLKNKVIAGRDSFGIKPLYLLRENDSIYLSSEIKGFIPLKKLKFDEKSIYSVLTMQYHDTYNTLFEDVKQIQPGTIIIIDIKNKTIEEQKYFEQNYSENNKLSYEDTKIVLFDKIDNAIKSRLRTDRNIGFTLSGGIDSATILSLGSKHIDNKNKQAYTICFENSEDFNEFKDAKAMADMYGFNFNQINVNEKILIENFEKAIIHSEQVSINMHLPSKYLLFKKMADDGVQVSLSGEGSDEIFFGYPHFKMDLNIMDSLDKNIYLKGIQMPDNDILDTSKIQKYLGYIPAFIKAKYSMGYKIHNHILKDEFKYKNNSVDPASDIIRLYDLDKNIPNIFNSSILWSKICLSNYILNALGDKLEMAHTIEGRVPFLDRDIFDFVKNISIDQKINNGNEKYILKEIMKPYITKEIYLKQKHPFIAPPLFDWNNNKFSYEHIMDVIHSKIILESQFFDQEKIFKMIDLIINNKLNKSSFDPVIIMILSLYYLEKNFILRD